VRVRLGEIIPADIKLIEGDYLSVDESMLTGESLPVERHVSDICYAGSIIRQGEMNAVVTATGMNTYFGKTVKLVAEAKTQSHFQKAVLKVGNYLIVLAVSLVALIFLVALFRQRKCTGDTPVFPGSYYCCNTGSPASSSLRGHGSGGNRPSKKESHCQ